MATSYVVTDRTTAAAVAIKVDAGQIYVETGAAGPSAEPIVLDQGDLSTHWKIFVEDGQLGVESTATVQNDTVNIVDGTTAETWLLGVTNGTIQITTSSGGGAIDGGMQTFFRRRRR